MCEDKRYDEVGMIFHVGPFAGFRKMCILANPKNSGVNHQRLTLLDVLFFIAPLEL